MSTIAESAGVASGGGYDRRRELQAFHDTKAGVKGLVDAGVTTVPGIFRHPPGSLEDLEPCAGGAGLAAAAIPVVDLAGAAREETVARVRHAAETVGFFQVVNHGVPGDLMARMLAAVRRFNEQPAEAKRPLYTRDVKYKVRFSSNFSAYLDHFPSAVASWRDTLFCDLAPDPPRPEELPEPVRSAMPEYGAAVTKMAMWLLELLSESLGLEPSHLREMGCAESLTVVSHYYPPCPEPHLTLGTNRHTDPTFVTVLLQDGMGGLQALLDRADGRRGWVDVPPVPGALIVNVGDLLQLISNGRFKSVVHRVRANSSGDTPRVSVASFFSADMKGSTRLYGPIPEIKSSDGGGGGGEPPVYRSVTAREYLKHFYSKVLDGHPLDDFRLE